MWYNVFIMQLSTERHVSTLQGHHQTYKIMVLVKVHAVVLPTGYRGLQFNIYIYIPLFCIYTPLFCKPDDGPVGSKHVAQLIVA